MKKQKLCVICKAPLPENAPLARKTCSDRCRSKQNYEIYKKCIANRKAGTPLMRQQLDMYKYMAEQIVLWKSYMGKNSSLTNGMILNKADISNIVKYAEVVIRALGKAKMPMPKKLDAKAKQKNKMILEMVDNLLRYAPLVFTPEDK